MKPLFRDPNFKPLPRPPVGPIFDEFRHTQRVGATAFLILAPLFGWFLIYFHFHKLY